MLLPIKEIFVNLHTQTIRRQMKEVLLILVITIVAIVICGFLIGIKIFLQKNGKFSHTCAFDWEEEKCKDCNGNCKDCTVEIGKIST